MLDPRSVERLLRALSRAFPGEPGEITLELNPGVVECERIPEFRRAGITRLSVGLQSLHDAVLKQLGRAVLSQFLTNASEAFEKPSTGGSMHLPNVHVGAHLLRVRKTETGSYLIMRRHGEFPVAHLELETEDAAVEMFEVLHRHMVEEELTGAPQRVIRRGERELLLKYNAGPRRFSLHRNDSVLKVTDMLGKRLCGAAIVANEEHGQELFELLINHYERGAGDPSGTFDLLTPRPHLTV